MFTKFIYFCTQVKPQHWNVARSVLNQQKNLAYARDLPRDWDEKKIQKYLDPEEKYISKVSLVKDRLGQHTGRALIEANTESDCQQLIEKYNGQFIDTKEVFQRISLKMFELKVEKQKLDIVRNSKQAYVSGLPRDIRTEDFLELLADFGEIEKIDLPRHQNNQTKGYAFVLFKRPNDAYQFGQFMNGKQFLGKKLRVQIKDFQFDSQKPKFTSKNLQEGELLVKENEKIFEQIQKNLEVLK